MTSEAKDKMLLVQVPYEQRIINDYQGKQLIQLTVTAAAAVAWQELVKENSAARSPLGAGWLWAGLCATLLAALLAARPDQELPAPRAAAAPAHMFSAHRAHRHLLDLTDIGPRVAGSYENEVAAVGVVMAALRGIARGAGGEGGGGGAPGHNRLDFELHTASGAFPITFFDGMNNVYRNVSMVVARLSPRVVDRPGSGAKRPALLLNCHYDTVPDSPGASDDGAGCAVVLEVVRALSARGPLRRDVVALLNGAEENIMQASHAFVTSHRWAKGVRAFLNLEACGAGGREVLFQAGPHDPWIMEVYARTVPHPFASSLAQELFESGLVPADTDFRVFRDFGNLSGVDLAWSANGYVYHTPLDTVAQIPLESLQRTGENVLEFVLGMLEHEEMDRAVDRSSRQPVFFDVLGRALVTARPARAAAALVAALALVALNLELSARHAQRHLWVSRRVWYVAVWGWWWRGAVAALAGLLAGAAGAAALHAAGARLTFYARPLLLLPLYVAPAVGGTWLVWLQLADRGSGAMRAVARGWRGWGAALAAHDALTTHWAALLAAAAALHVRSGFWPLQCALSLALADLAPLLLGLQGGARAMWWCVGGALPAVQSWYVGLATVTLFVPLTARAGTSALPPDVMVALLSGALALAAGGWLLPLVAASASRGASGAARALLALGAGSALLVLLARPAPYSALRPMRLMVFHTRRTHHAAPTGDPSPADQVDNFYWIPDLDANTPHILYKEMVELRAAEPTSLEECRRWVYCGAPYFLPVVSLVVSGRRVRAPRPPLAALTARLELTALNRTAHLLSVNITGPTHVVVLVAPVAGSRVTWSNVVERPVRAASDWRQRPVYFFTLFQPHVDRPWLLQVHIERAESAGEGSGGGGGGEGAVGSGGVAQVMVAGHAMSGARRLHEDHARLLRSAPAWAAATGWGVDLHLYDL